MIKNCKFTKFIKKSQKEAQDIVCINVIDSDTRKSEKCMFINTSKDSIGFENHEFKNYIDSNIEYIIKNKEGKTFTYDFDKKGYVKCWIEPFYYRENYGAIGIMAENIEKGLYNTLVRSIKHSGAYSFLPNFDESKNPFKENQNLFYQKIESVL